MEKEIVIYTQNGCQHCSKIKELLKAGKISFIEKNKAEHPKDWAKIHTLTGLAVLPTLVINGEHLIPGRDYNMPEQAVAYIRNVENSGDILSEYSHEEKLKEGFKTLTYSINQGFSRIFQELNRLKEKQDGNKSTS